MKRAISPRAARAAALVAIAARLFLGLVIDAPTTQNGAWLSAIIGCLLAAPLLFLLAHCRFKSVLLIAALGALAAVDAASVLFATSRSAGYLALDRSTVLLLSLPISLAALWALWRGGDAVGYAAMIWARIALALLVVVALLQVKYFRVGWLYPIFGEGWRAILDGGVKVAGWIVAASSVLALPDDARKSPPVLPALFSATAIASLLILLRCMLAPTQLRSGWLNRLDALLCNGRTPLYLQLPMIALWFASLFHLLACELLAAAGCLRKLLPGLSEKLCAMTVVTLALGISRLSVLARWTEALSEWSFAVIGVIAALSFITSRREGGERVCGFRES